MWCGRGGGGEWCSEFIPICPDLLRGKLRPRLAKRLPASYWYSQVLNLWMAGLSFFSYIKLPYTHCILVGQRILSFQDKNHLCYYPHLPMTNKSSMQSNGDLVILFTELWVAALNLLLSWQYPIGPARPCGKLMCYTYRKWPDTSLFGSKSPRERTFLHLVLHIHANHLHECYRYI